MSTLRLVNETATRGAPIPFAASFATDRPAGRVVGRDGVGGIDREGVIGVDHGALRIRPLVQPGWGRSAATWGPFETQCGLVASLQVLNGHNASENEEPWPSTARFVLQWLRGTQVDAVTDRLRALRRYGGRDTLRRRLQMLRASRVAISTGTAQRENLAVGLFGSGAPRDAGAGGPVFVMRSTGPTNGTLEAGTAGRLPLIDSVQNVPLQLVIIVREEGALFAAGSLEGADGFAAAPAIRPLAIDTHPLPPALHAGVHQAVLGQVGWGVDTRVGDVRVAQHRSWSAWFTTAHCADRPGRLGDLAGAPAEHGGRWHVARLGANRAIALLRPGGPSSLVHVRFQFTQAEQRVGVAVRVHAPATADGVADGWLVSLSSGGAVAERFRNGEVVRRHQADVAVAVARDSSLQVLDDGSLLRVVLDGEVVLGPFSAEGADGLAVGLRQITAAEAPTVHGFEAHPTMVVLPPELAGTARRVPRGTELVYDDDFRVARCADPDLPANGVPARPGDPQLLGHRPVAEQGPTWEHTIGSTPFLLDVHGAVVQPVAPPPSGASGKLRALVRAEEHRNAYTLPWPDPASAELTVSLVAPGSGPGQGQRGRGGLVFRQDRDHQLIVNTWIDDEYGGTSVSSFLRIGGFEDVYDAVWTNVGRRITYGTPYDLRVAFDGDRYVVWVDAEPVLYRRITDIVPAAPRLRIEQVGIVSNWEFGDDTGTRFLRFRAHAAHRAGGLAKDGS